MSTEAETKPARPGSAALAAAVDRVDAAEAKAARARPAPNGAGNEAVTAAARLAEVMDSLVIWRGECEARLRVLEALAQGQAEDMIRLQAEQEEFRLGLEAIEKRMDRMASWGERKNQQMAHVMARLDAIGERGS